MVDSAELVITPDSRSSYSFTMIGMNKNTQRIVNALEMELIRRKGLSEPRELGWHRAIVIATALEGQTDISVNFSFSIESGTFSIDIYNITGRASIQFFIKLHTFLYTETERNNGNLSEIEEALIILRECSIFPRIKTDSCRIIIHIKTVQIETIYIENLDIQEMNRLILILKASKARTFSELTEEEFMAIYALRER